MTELVSNAADLGVYHPPISSYADLRELLREQPVAFDDVCLELIPHLRAEILNLSQTRTPYPSKNRGGWKSDERVFDAGPALTALRADLVNTFLFQRKPTGWAMVNRNGSEHPRHQHRLASISGIYYVDGGDPEVPTIFEIGGKDTGPPRERTPKSEMQVPPVPGRLVLFSGPTWHRVPQYIGTAPRITISFDVPKGA